MERAALLVDGPLVTADRLELATPRNQRASPPEDHETTPSDAPAGIALGQTVEEVERRRILEALHETRWNISRAASRLGVTRNILRYRVQKYGLRLPPGPAELTEPTDGARRAVQPTTGRGPVNVQWERRHVALLRADLVPMAVTVVPAAGAALETLVEKIESFGGQVEEVSPAGLVAVFGLEPVEDAPRRAAHAALAIQKVAAHARGRSAESPEVRVGLHVGEVLVAWVGGAARVDHAAKREAWQQLEAFMGGAEAGTVLVSEATRPFLERRFVLAPVAAGDGTAGTVCRLVGLERTALGLGELLTPFVRRGRELEQLAEALEHARQRHGQVVAVVGEAGVGKSRLLFEFINSHGVRDSLILVSSAASYGKGMPYLPVIDLLKVYFQIEPQDDASRIRERVTEKVLSRESALASALSPVLALIDVPVDDAQWPELDPAQQQRRTLEAVKLLLLEESRRQPVTVLFEDLHWIDSKTQAVLADRSARLSPEDRALLQTAAAIGNDVPLALLRAVADLPEEVLRAALSRLQGSEFLYGTKIVPGPEFAFKHALSHEVAYAGLLPDRRRALHTRALAAIEQLYADRLAEYVDRLAHHALRGEVWDTAVAYLREAGAKAAARSAYREAVACFEQALEALRHLSESRGAIEQRIDLLLELRNSLYALGEFQRVFDYLCEGKILAEQIGDQRRLGWISAFMAFHFWRSSDLDRAVQSGHRALAVATACGDFALRVVANLRLGQAYLALGDYPRAREYFQSNVESLEGDLIRERFGEAHLPSVQTRLWLVHVLAARGEFAEGIARGEEGVQIAQTVDDPFSLIGAYRGLGYLYLRKGDFNEAIRFLERSRELSQAWSIRSFIPGILWYLGYAHAVCGRLTEGLSLLEQGLEQGASMGEFSGYAENLANSSEAYRLANREEDAIRIANQALDFSRNHKRQAHEPWALRALGELALHRDPPDTERAEVSSRQAMVLAADLGRRPLVAHCHLGFGKLYGRMGKRQEAAEHLTTASTMYRAMDMRFWLDQTEAEVSRL